MAAIFNCCLVEKNNLFAETRLVTIYDLKIFKKRKIENFCHVAFLHKTLAQPTEPVILSTVVGSIRSQIYRYWLEVSDMYNILWILERSSQATKKCVAGHGLRTPTLDNSTTPSRIRLYANILLCSR